MAAYECSINSCAQAHKKVNQFLSTIANGHKHPSRVDLPTVDTTPPRFCGGER